MTLIRYLAHADTRTFIKAGLLTAIGVLEFKESIRMNNCYLWLAKEATFRQQTLQLSSH